MVQCLMCLFSRLLAYWGARSSLLYKPSLQTRALQVSRCGTLRREVSTSLSSPTPQAGLSNQVLSICRPHYHSPQFLSSQVERNGLPQTKIRKNVRCYIKSRFLFLKDHWSDSLKIKPAICCLYGSLEGGKS